MKKHAGFKYRSSCTVCVCAFLALIGLTVLSPSAFAFTDGDYTYSVSGGNATITGYTGPGGAITIPATLGTFPVVAIGDYAFSENTTLTSVTIGNSVTSIGNYAFAICTSLTSVTIPNSVTSIGAGAFISCSSLTSITIPNSVTSISVYTFASCSGLTSVTIPNSVTSIGDAAFGFCTGLTSVTIGNSVTSIGVEAFYNCSSLTSVTIPNGVTSIGAAAFQYCYGLTKANFLGNAPSIGADVFSSCASTFSICYVAGATGFTTPTWNGYPAAVCVDFAGFFEPIDNEIVNVAKAGQAIPVKWRLTDFTGMPISDPASFVGLYSYSVMCSDFSGIPTDAIEQYAAVASGLQYMGDGYWQFNWKTPKGYAGKCIDMYIQFEDGTTSPIANFKFK